MKRNNIYFDYILPWVFFDQSKQNTQAHRILFTCNTCVILAVYHWIFMCSQLSKQLNGMHIIPNFLLQYGTTNSYIGRIYNHGDAMILALLGLDGNSTVSKKPWIEIFSHVNGTNFHSAWCFIGQISRIKWDFICSICAMLFISPISIAISYHHQHHYALISFAFSVGSLLSRT